MKPLILALSIICASDCAAQAFSREKLIAGVRKRYENDTLRYLQVRRIFKTTFSADSSIFNEILEIRKSGGNFYYKSYSDYDKSVVVAGGKVVTTFNLKAKQKFSNSFDEIFKGGWAELYQVAADPLQRTLRLNSMKGSSVRLKGDSIVQGNFLNGFVNYYSAKDFTFLGCANYVMVPGEGTQVKQIQITPADPFNMDAAIGDPKQYTVFTKPPTVKQLSIGDSIPLFKVKDIFGKTHELTDKEDKLTLIEYFYESCMPCFQMIPELNRLQARYGDNLRIIAADFVMRDTANIDRFVSKWKLEYPVVAGKDAQLLQGLRRWHGAPYTILIGRDRKIIAIYQGYAKRYLKRLEKNIRRNI